MRNGESNATLLILKKEEGSHEPKDAGDLEKLEKAKKQEHSENNATLLTS